MSTIVNAICISDMVGVIFVQDGHLRARTGIKLAISLDNLLKRPEIVLVTALHTEMSE